MKKSFKLIGLECAHCAEKMEAQINKIEGVSAKISFISARLFFEAEDSVFSKKLDEAQKAIGGIERGCKIER